MEDERSKLCKRILYCAGKNDVEGMKEAKRKLRELTLREKQRGKDNGT